MIILLDEENERLFSRLYVSNMDLASAEFSLLLLLKNGWHAEPWEGEALLYRQQAAYVTSFVVAYARPFTHSKGWPKFPAELMSFNDDERRQHERVLTMRHQVVAHSDSASYSIRPWRTDNFSSEIVGAPALRLSREECERLQAMLGKLRDAIYRKLDEMVPIYPRPV